MIKAGFLHVLLAFSILPLWACDVCGCASSMGTGSSGINNRLSLISLRSQYAGFYAFDHQGLRASDQYMQLELFGQFALFQKLQLQVDVPYGIRLRDYKDNSRTMTGLGDPWAQLNYYPVSIQADENHKASQEVSIGLGIKAPLGNFQPESSRDGLTPLPANFQLGTGSWDNFINISYRWQLDKWGFQLMANSRLNRQNQRLYKFGNQTATQAIIFRWLERKQHVFRLFGGAYAEWVQSDQQFSMELTGTGGQGYYASAGVEYVRKDFAFNFQATQPLIQEYAGGSVSARSRLGFSFSYLL